jgi:hypothetical protein
MSNADEEMDSEELDGEAFQLPQDALRQPLDSAELLEAELREREPEYGDLIDSGWIDRAARIEELDDDRTNSLDVGLTLDLSDSDEDEELGQMVDLDVGTLLTPLPRESESDRDTTASLDASFGVGALRDLLLPDESDLENEQEQEVDDARFPAFDDAPVPSRTTSSETSFSQRRSRARDSIAARPLGERRRRFSVHAAHFRVARSEAQR